MESMCKYTRQLGRSRVYLKYFNARQKIIQTWMENSFAYHDGDGWFFNFETII